MGIWFAAIGVIGMANLTKLVSGAWLPRERARVFLASTQLAFPASR